MGTIITGLASLLLAFACAYLKSRWNIDIDAATQAKFLTGVKSFTDFSKRQANIWIAAQQPGWEDKVITVNDPWIVAQANAGIAAFPEAMALIGMTLISLLGG